MEEICRVILQVYYFSQKHYSSAIFHASVIGYMGFQIDHRLSSSSRFWSSFLSVSLLLFCPADCRWLSLAPSRLSSRMGSSCSPLSSIPDDGSPFRSMRVSASASEPFLRYHRKKYTNICARKTYAARQLLTIPAMTCRKLTCSMVYSKTGICIYALVKLSASLHMAVTSGIPRLVVLAAPQKHTATVCSRFIRLTERMRRTKRGRRRSANEESARRGLTVDARRAGGRAM